MSELTYTKVGDYLLPNLTLPQQNNPLNKYGRMRAKYLEEQRPILYQTMLLNGTLNSHLTEIDQIAQKRLDRMMPILMAQNGVTEELKQKDQMKWVGLMNSCHQQIEETILNELVYN